MLAVAVLTALLAALSWLLAALLAALPWILRLLSGLALAATLLTALPWIVLLVLGIHFVFVLTHYCYSVSRPRCENVSAA
jgi:hypothetical protein